ncbi:MAG TPA: hypothetical protein VMY59_07760 [Candidatus Thermoplasmatota archaeon]|nr:hypothetical protein [Candidatus Thermoplasmatota archaeon]
MPIDDETVVFLDHRILSQTRATRPSLGRSLGHARSDKANHKHDELKESDLDNAMKHAKGLGISISEYLAGLINERRSRKY